MLRILTLILLLFSFLPSWCVATEKHVKQPTAKTVATAKPVKAKSKTKLIKAKLSSNKSAKAKSIQDKKKVASPKSATATQHSKTRHNHAVKKRKIKHPVKAVHAKNAYVSRPQHHLASVRLVNDEEYDDDEDSEDSDDAQTTNTTNFLQVKNSPTIETVQSIAVSPKTQQLVEYAKRFLGTSYRFGGYSPATGFDCSGYVSYVYSHVAGIALPHNASAISRIGSKIPRANLRPGDLVFFGHRFHRAIGHVGIYMGNNRFIHASSSRTGYVEISDLRERYWTRRFEGGRRLMEG